MGEAEQPGVQGLARECGNLRPARPGVSNRSPGTRAIDRIADQRVAEMGEMNPDLVGAARSQAAFDLRRMDAVCTLDPITGERRFSPSFRDARYLFAVHAAAADVAGDLARRHGRHTPDKGGVSAIDPACGKIARQRTVRHLGLGDYHEAAGVLVEPMNDPRAPDPA